MQDTNRRGFLKKSGVLSAALATAISARRADAAETQRGAAASRKPPLRIGLMTYNLARNWGIETIIKNCSQAKFEHVELRTTHAHKVEVDLTAKQRAEVKKRFENSPLKAISLASGFSYHHADAKKLRENIEGTKKYTILARDIGAKGIRVFPNALTDTGVSEEKTLEQIGASVREVGKFAADYGVEIRLANHGRGTNRIKVTKRILDYADSKHVYVNWNCDGTDIEEPGFEANFNLVKSRIRNIHMHRLHDEKYPYRRLFELLRRADYPGYCDAEIPESCEPIELMKYYRALFLAYQNVI
ncbi:MAG: TIM barrel protein [Phycisphaerales bacterium]|nr:MAG: TIM barrel protein [Phycisphaerales bacterium]